MITITKELLSDWFKKFNRLYFNGKIKREPNYVITKTTSILGMFKPSTWTINISTAYIRSERNYINTFLHELCHLYVREKYGYHVQHHGVEWKEVADMITSRTGGKYGTIQRVDGGIDKDVLRETKGTNKYVVFVDYVGHLSIAKYGSEDYVKRLIELDCVMDNTEIRYYVSNNVEMDYLRKRRANGYTIRWNYLKWTLEELNTMATLVSKTMYHKRKQAA